MTAQVVIDERIFDAILKGIIEEGESGWHFGSLGGHRFYLERCAESGLITYTGDVTVKGHERYQSRHLAALPDSRWYFWDKTA
ncbi:hypothetical protein [Marinobacterium sp. BA1]|uniref:hypothetical protein n=1 Tax=Marinobacterium sp. BA1 TaxID=3138931 RepID=UPI0032E5A16D